MSNKKIIWLSVAGILLVPAVMDAIRYLKPDAEKEQTIQPYGSFPMSNAYELILVYNAWGGLYPGLVDFLHKELFPKSYPCNLCYQTFSTFSMKEEWKRFLNSLPYQITELHKDNFHRQYKPKDMQLPVILLRQGNEVQVLLSAAKINQYHSLDKSIEGVREKLK